MGFGDKTTRSSALSRARSGPACHIPTAGRGEALEQGPCHSPAGLSTLHNALRAGTHVQVLYKKPFCYVFRPRGLVPRPYVLPATGSLCSDSIDSLSNPLLHSCVLPPSWSFERDLLLGAGPGLCFSCPLDAAPWPVPHKPCSHPGSGTLAEGSGVRMIGGICVMA